MTWRQTPTGWNSKRRPRSLADGKVGAYRPDLMRPQRRRPSRRRIWMSARCQDVYRLLLECERNVDTRGNFGSTKLSRYAEAARRSGNRQSPSTLEFIEP